MKPPEVEHSEAVEWSDAWTEEDLADVCRASVDNFDYQERLPDHAIDDGQNGATPS